MVLHDLSVSRNMRLLSSDAGFTNAENGFSHNSRRVDKVMEYINRHFDKELTLSETAKIAAMTEVAFSRFLKIKQVKLFIDTLNEIRPGHASRMLIDTSYKYYRGGLQMRRLII